MRTIRMVNPIVDRGRRRSRTISIDPWHRLVVFCLLVTGIEAFVWETSPLMRVGFPPVAIASGLQIIADGNRSRREQRVAVCLVGSGGLLGGVVLPLPIEHTPVVAAAGIGLAVVGILYANVRVWDYKARQD